MVLLFDHEEVGSESALGAGSNFLETVLRRLYAMPTVGSSSPSSSNNNANDPSAFERSLANSLLVSADMAHAIHPNYPEKHEAQHQPRMNGGLVLKHNANQRYATTALSAAIVTAAAAASGGGGGGGGVDQGKEGEAEMPVQQFVVRNDSPCGSTIGTHLHI